MKKISYVLLVIISFGVLSFVKAENISYNDIINKFKAEQGYTVSNENDGSFTVNTGTATVEYSYSANDNILSYDAGAGKQVKAIVDSDKLFFYVVQLSSNLNDYQAAKSANPKPEGVDYGTGCDLVNMGFCYDSTSGKMQVSLSNQFTTYLYNFYNAGGVVEPAANNSQDPVVVDPETAQDSSNPDTGTFTEFSIIIGLLVLLLIVVSLKRKSETEFKI